MIVKLKCVDNGGNTDITPKKVCAGLSNINGVYVVRNDMGHLRLLISTTHTAQNGRL